MKNRGLRNRFNQEKLRAVWAFEYSCLWCGESGFDCFHHIMSPSSPRYLDGKFNSSILNACPIHNQKCHLYNPELHKIDSERKMLQGVLKHLVLSGFKFKDKDAEFYEKYSALYNSKGLDRHINKD